MFSQVNFDITAALADKENVGSSYQTNQVCTSRFSHQLRVHSGMKRGSIKLLLLLLNCYYLILYSHF